MITTQLSRGLRSTGRTRTCLTASVAGMVIAAMAASVSGCATGAAPHAVAGVRTSPSVAARTSPVAPTACFVNASARTVPAAGSLLWGAIPDWPHVSAAQYARRIGHAPAVYSAAQPFPLDKVSLGWTGTMLDETNMQGSMFALTLNPTSLKAVTTASATKLATFLGGWNRRGVGIFLRFAPEMNGTWFKAWGQQPTEYRTAARTLAAAVHKLAPKTAMVWAPNIAPTGTSLEVRSNLSKADFAALDTNHNHKIDAGDNAYSPYYPGDSSVDWVALSLYSRGHGWPRKHNDVPSTNELYHQIGHSVSAKGKLSKGFYDQFALGHRKPMALAETAAAWAANRTGATELKIKQAWWRQVFDLVRVHKLTAFKMAIFFEVNKAESDIGRLALWSIDDSKVIVSAFAKDLAGYHVTSARHC